LIVTVTLNAAFARTITVPNFQRGQRHRASAGLPLAGGKGINVARALKALDVPVVATGLAGGQAGLRIVERLTGEAVLNDFVNYYGPQAATPKTYFEMDWRREAWSRGCPVGHTGTNVLSRYGPALRVPFRRIHWAGRSRPSATSRSTTR